MAYTLTQTLAAEATLMRDGQGGGSTNVGLSVITLAADRLELKDPTIAVGATGNAWETGAPDEFLTRFGLPQIP